MNTSRVLITGASSGIGEQTAYLFAEKGWDLVLVARNEEELLRVKNNIDSDVLIIPCDLTEEGSVEKIFRECGRIDLLINNAGIGLYGDFADSDIEKQIKIISLNNEALLRMCHRFVRDGHGQIINVASIGAFFPSPLLSVYYASKSFVLSFSLALREELKKKDIIVSCMCPGPVRTAFNEKAGNKENAFFKKYLMADPKKIAEGIYDLSVSKRAYKVNGLINRLGIFFMSLVPMSLKAIPVYRLQRKSKRDV